MILGENYGDLWGFKLITETVNLTDLDGTYTAGGTKNTSVSVAKTGYKPLGVVGYNKTGGSGSTYITLVAYHINQSTEYLSVYAKNMSSSQSEAAGTSVDILYQPL